METEIRKKEIHPKIRDSVREINISMEEKVIQNYHGHMDLY